MHDEYFNYLTRIVCHTKRQKTKYSKLLFYMYTHPFNYILPIDNNRESDGIGLRYLYRDETAKRFSTKNVEQYVGEKSSSILEMLIALAADMENIMYDLNEDRTYYWFWEMLQSLNLHTMTDDVFDENKVAERLDIWMSREYDPVTGAGGLFTFKNPQSRDLREVEIWCLAMWHLTEVVNYGT